MHFMEKFHPNKLDEVKVMYLHGHHLVLVLFIARRKFCRSLRI